MSVEFNLNDMIKASSSRLSKYVSCNATRNLYDQFEFHETDAMIMGTLFEALIFNPQGDHSHIYQSWVSKRTGVLTAAKEQLVDKIKQDALKVMTDYRFIDYETSVKFDFENKTVSGQPYSMRGEFDFIGQLNGMRCIADIKYTASFNNNWFWPIQEQDPAVTMQSLVYTYVHNLMSGESLPFVYLVFDHSTGLHHQIKVRPTQKDYNELEKLIDMYVSGLHTDPNDSNCIKGRGRFQKVCDYAHICPHFSRLKTSNIDIELPSMSLEVC